MRILSNIKSSVGTHTVIRLRLGLLLILFLYGQAGIAAQANAVESLEPAPFSILTIHYGDDSANGNSFSIEADLGLPHGNRVMLGGGDDFTTEYRTETKTSTYHVGISSDPQQYFSAALDYQQWGRVDSLTTETWRIDAGARADNFQARVATEFKTIHIYDRVANLYDVDSHSYGLNLSYSFPGHWFADLGYKSIDYDKDIRQETFYLLRRGLLPLVFTAQTLQLLTTLDESQTTFNAGVDIGDDQLGVDWVSSEAIFESVSYTIASVYYDKVLSDHWSANLRFGRQQTDSSRISDLDIYSLSLSYFW